MLPLIADMPVKNGDTLGAVLAEGLDKEPGASTSQAGRDHNHHAQTKAVIILVRVTIWA